MREASSFAPGRTEVAGNHTDHQGGRVIAAAVDCGVSVTVRENASRRARVESVGYAPFEIALDDVTPREDERFTTAALVRGVVAGLRAAGGAGPGVDARVQSSVPGGSGLSSSAAFELALAQALCALGNGEGALAGGNGAPFAPQVRLARIGQAAEREWFGKACGLMDQLAVAVGGIALFDFAGDEPRIERIDFDFGESGYELFLIDTHCDHSRYTEAYSQVARDMDAVAALLGARVLSQVAEEAFLERFEDVRAALGDVPALRALHYYHEMRLVDARAQALRSGDMNAFLQFTRQSGASSAQYLQNVSTYDRASQPAMVALALADLLLEGEGACRIHGGGFGGTVQAFVPHDRADAFARRMDARLGAGSCRAYRIGANGAHAER